MAPYISCENRRFERTCRLNLLGRKNPGARKSVSSWLAASWLASSRNFPTVRKTGDRPLSRRRHSSAFQFFTLSKAAMFLNPRKYTCLNTFEQRDSRLDILPSHSCSFTFTRIYGGPRRDSCAIGLYTEDILYVTESEAKSVTN